MKFIIDSADSIAKDPDVSPADRIKSESIKLEALGMLKDAIEASMSCHDPHSTLEKIAEEKRQRAFSNMASRGFCMAKVGVVKVGINNDAISYNINTVLIEECIKN